MMYKFLIVLNILLFGFALGEDLQGKITYNEETARIEAFKDLSRKISKSMFKNDLKDMHYKENYASLKKKIFEIETEPKRILTPFYVMNQLAVYGVQYENDANMKYYYNVFGHLAKIEISDYSGIYPYRAVSYNKNGELISIVLNVSETESFVFDKNEELLGHWFDEDFYNNKGKRKLKREFNR